MIIHRLNLFAAPLLLLAWAIDVYLFLACIRLGCNLFKGSGAARLRTTLRPVTDPLPEAISGRLSGHLRRPVPLWLSWLLVFLLGMVLRQLLLLAALAAA
ncbi:MAG: hypothetical protein WBD44_02365 [Phycisphaerae bacterium]